MCRVDRCSATGSSTPLSEAAPPVNWSPLAQHQERDQRSDGREADGNDNDVEPRHAGFLCDTPRTALGLPGFDFNVRPPDLRDFAMPPIRRLGAVLCQETEFRWR